MSNKSSKALVKSEDFDVRGTALELYGSRESIREMVDRLMAFHPAAREVGREGMLGAAHLAHLVGASPLPSVNEIHVWKDKDDKTCIYLGVNYYRRRAHELGGVYWIDQPRLMTQQERDERGIPTNDLAGIAQAARRDDVDTLVERWMSLTPRPNFKEIFQAALEVSSRAGIASCRKGGYGKKNRPASWDVLKGAEIDLLRQLFPNLEQKPSPERQRQLVEEIPQAGVDDDTLTMEEIEELARMRERGEAFDAEWEELSDEERQERGEAAGAALYGRYDEDDPLGTDTKHEPLPDIDLDEVEEVPFGEEEPDPEPPTCPDCGEVMLLRRDGSYCDKCGQVEEEPEPEPEPEPEYIPDPEKLRLQLRACAKWIKDGSRPNKQRLSGDESQPPDEGTLKRLNITLRAGLSKDSEIDSKALDEARRDLVQYVYSVRTTSALTAKEAGSLLEHFADTQNKQLRPNASAEMWAMVIAQREELGQQQLPGM